MRCLIALILCLLAGCVTTPIATDPAIVARIVEVCMSSGYFKVINGVVATLVPQATLPVALVNAGIDQICTHPETAAADASTVEWLIENLKKT